MRARSGLCLAALLAAWPGAAFAQDLAVSGRAARPGTLALAALQALPAVTVELTQATGRARYTGALLWTVIEAAGPVDAAGPHSYLQHTVLASGRDGYSVALSIAELDPGFAGKQVLIAYAQDGKALDRLRLVVPGDAKAGRAVRDLVAVEIR